MKNRLKVLWLTNIPSPYRVDFFNEFGKYCDLTVLFEKRASAERNKSWQNYKIINFKAVFLKGISVGVAESICLGIIKYLNKKKYDKFFVTNYSDISGILAIAVMKIRRISYIIEGDGAFEGSGDGIKEKLKKWIISDAELCFSTSEEHDKYYKRYGANNIIRYPFTSVKEEDLLSTLQVTNKDRILLRNSMKISERTSILFFGDFLRHDLFEKNCEMIEKLINIMSNQPEVLLIGEEFYIGYIQWENERDNIHLIINETEDNLAKYYIVADGLIILNNCNYMTNIIGRAMFFGMSVIVSAKCIDEVKLRCGNFISYVFELERILNQSDFAKIIKENKDRSIKPERQILTLIKKSQCLNLEQYIWILRNIVRELEKNKLGIAEHNVILSVGQFIYRKGFDILIKSAMYILTRKNRLHGRSEPL